MNGAFYRFACWTSEALGSHRAFLVACLVVLVWAVTGPAFQFSDSWQLVINTGTTIVTFLMVFLIQATQNRETRALHLKLDELIRAQSRARNLFAALEHASEEELEGLEAEFRRLRAHAAAEEGGRGAEGTSATASSPGKARSPSSRRGSAARR